jgi:hypothetical protein
MASSEGRSHSFIVKIWREKLDPKRGQAIWRGHITHVPGGERQYFTRLIDIVLYIAPYLEQLGVEPGVRWRITKWLMRWKKPASLR